MSPSHIIAPPIESELSFLTGTFLSNYDVINRKRQPLLISSDVEKRAKRMPDNMAETTCKKMQEQLTQNYAKQLVFWFSTQMLFKGFISI